MSAGIGCAIAAAIGFVIIPIIGLLAAIAIPAFLQYRTDTQSGLCQNNLRLITHAKGVHAVKENLTSGEEADPRKVNEYINGGQPVCQDGGTYEYNKIDEDPVCSYGGDHTL